jgi:hypothetical protein
MVDDPEDISTKSIAIDADDNPDNIDTAALAILATKQNRNDGGGQNHI